MKKVVLIHPPLADIGGVSILIGHLLTVNDGFRSLPLPKRRFGLNFMLKLLRLNNNPVLLNTSLQPKSLVRDFFYSLLLRNYYVFWHGWEKDVLESYVLRRFFTLYVRRSKHNFVLAKDFSEAVVYYGSDKVSVVSTCSPKVETPAQRRHSRTLKILFLSRLVEEKGVLQLIDICGIIPGVHLNVAGHGPLEDLVREKCLKYENVEFVGSASGSFKHHLLVESDVFCLPTSYGEGMPVSIIEAISYGLYIVSTKNAGIGDHVIDETMGKILKIGDWQGLAQILNDLVNNDELLDEVYKHNIEYHASNFTPAYLAELLMREIK